MNSEATLRSAAAQRRRRDIFVEHRGSMKPSSVRSGIFRPYGASCSFGICCYKDVAPDGALVDRLLAAKQRDAEVDTSAWEREIDELVYALYGLTPEEIKVLEEATS